MTQLVHSTVCIPTKNQYSRIHQLRGEANHLRTAKTTRTTINLGIFFLNTRGNFIPENSLRYQIKKSTWVASG